MKQRAHDKTTLCVKLGMSVLDSSCVSEKPDFAKAPAGLMQETNPLIDCKILGDLSGGDQLTQHRVNSLRALS